MSLQPVTRIGAIFALREPELQQRRVKQLAGKIAGERPAGAVGAMLARREPDDRQPRVTVAERRHRRIPPVGMFGAALMPERDQPRTQRAVARRLGLRDRRQVGGLDHRTFLSSPIRPEAKSKGRWTWFPSAAQRMPLRLAALSASLGERIVGSRPCRTSTPSPSAPTARTAAMGDRRRWSRRRSPGLIRNSACSTASPIILNAAHGGAGRDFANAVALVESDLDPPEMLRRLKAIERDFGRRGGRRWGPRVLDLDIVLWSGGQWRSRQLTIPHPQLAKRSFVLQPLAAIAPGWRVRGALTIRHLAERLARRTPRST